MEVRAGKQFHIPGEQTIEGKFNPPKQAGAIAGEESIIGADFVAQTRRLQVTFLEIALIFCGDPETLRRIRPVLPEKLFAASRSSNG